MNNNRKIFLEHHDFPTYISRLPNEILDASPTGMRLTSHMCLAFRKISACLNLGLDLQILQSLQKNDLNLNSNIPFLKNQAL